MSAIRTLVRTARRANQFLNLLSRIRKTFVCNSNPPYADVVSLSRDPKTSRIPLHYAPLFNENIKLKNVHTFQFGEIFLIHIKYSLAGFSTNPSDSIKFSRGRKFLNFGSRIWKWSTHDSNSLGFVCTKPHKFLKTFFFCAFVFAYTNL